MNSVRSRKDRRGLVVSMGVMAGVLAMTMVCSVHAANRLWDNDSGDNLWNTAANWDGNTAIVSGDSLYFPDTRTGIMTNNVTSYGPLYLVFSNDYTVAGSEQISFDNGDKIILAGSAANVILDCDLYFANTVTITVPGGATLHMNGVVGGNTNPTLMDGGGTIRLTNVLNTQDRALNLMNIELEYADVAALGDAFTIKLGNWNAGITSCRLTYTGSGSATNSRPIQYGGAGEGQKLTIVNDSSGHGDLDLTGALSFTDKSNGEVIIAEFCGDSTGTTTVSGNFADHSSDGVDAITAIRLDSSGTLRLMGDSTYTSWTDIDAGTLLVNGTTASNGAYTVKSGGTLGGTGTVSGATTVLAGGKLSPGDGGAGTLTFTNTLDISGLATNDSGDLLYDLGETCDKIVLTSQALTIGSDELGASDFTFTGSISEDIVLIETAQSISGTLDPDDLRAAGGEIIAISDDGTDIVLLGAPPAGTVICIQ